jgi:uncharacterized delta-60 repeat protein
MTHSEAWRKLSSRASLTAGTLDTTFDSDGKVTTDFGSTDDAVWSIGIQIDGKIVAVGRTNTSSNGYDFALARYNADGSLDGTFGTGGKTTTNFNNLGDQRKKSGCDRSQAV